MYNQGVSSRSELSEDKNVSSDHWRVGGGSCVVGGFVRCGGRVDVGSGLPDELDVLPMGLAWRGKLGRSRCEWFRGKGVDDVDCDDEGLAEAEWWFRNVYGFG